MTARDPAPARGHTPGPWHNYGVSTGDECDPPEPGKKWITIANEDDGCIGDEVAVIVRRDPFPFEDEQYANARLIAAAPDLLAFVEKWQARMGNERTPVKLGTLREFNDEARQLLAAVQGRP